MNRETVSIVCETSGIEEKINFEWTLRNTGELSYFTSPEFTTRNGVVCYWTISKLSSQFAALFFAKECGTIGYVTPRIESCLRNLETNETITFPSASKLISNGGNISIRSNQGDFYVAKLMQSNHSFKFVATVYIMSVCTTMNRCVSNSATSEVGSFVEDLKLFRKTGDLCDLKIEAKDGTVFDVHSFLLCLRSKVFRAMLSHETKEAKERYIRIHDFSSSVVKKLIDFIYTDEVEHTEEDDCFLLMAADKYDLPKLKSICFVDISKKVTSENCVDLLIFADSCDCESLREYLIDYVVSHRNEISSEWSKLKERPALILRVISKL